MLTLWPYIGQKMRTAPVAASSQAAAARASTMIWCWFDALNSPKPPMLGIRIGRDWTLPATSSANEVKVANAERSTKSPSDLVWATWGRIMDSVWMFMFFSCLVLLLWGHFILSIFNIARNGKNKKHRGLVEIA